MALERFGVGMDAGLLAAFDQLLTDKFTPTALRRSVTSCGPPIPMLSLM